MRAVGYLRVSTEEQLSGTGLQGQQEAITALGHDIIKFCSDEGVSGSNGLDSRDGLAEALHLLSTGEVEAIIVYRLDRLARDMVLQETLLQDIRKYGQLISCSASETEFCRPGKAGSFADAMYAEYPSPAAVAADWFNGPDASGVLTVVGPTQGSRMMSWRRGRWTKPRRF